MNPMLQVQPQQKERAAFDLFVLAHLVVVTQLVVAGWRQVQSSISARFAEISNGLHGVFLETLPARTHTAAISGYPNNYGPFGLRRIRQGNFPVLPGRSPRR